MQNSYFNHRFIVIKADIISNNRNDVAVLGTRHQFHFFRNRIEGEYDKKYKTKYVFTCCITK